MILVPIKDLSNAKQRLSATLTQAERTALARAMAEDVFDALAPFASDPGVAIISGDAWASQQANSRRFTIILDTDQAGETAAIEMATTFCGSDFFPAMAVEKVKPRKPQRRSCVSHSWREGNWSRPRFSGWRTAARPTWQQFLHSRLISTPWPAVSVQTRFILPCAFGGSAPETSLCYS